MTKKARTTRSTAICELLHRERARAERSRQAYVALTRARRVAAPVRASAREADRRTGSNSAPTRIRCCTTSGRPSAETPRPSTPSARDEPTRKSRRRSRRPDRRVPRRMAAIAASRGCARRAASCRHRPPNRTKSNSAGRARLRGASAPWFTKRWNDSDMPRCRRVEDLPRMRARLESRLQALGVEPRARAQPAPNAR